MSAHRARKSSRASNLPAGARLRRLRRTEPPADTVRFARYLIGKTLVHRPAAGHLKSLSVSILYQDHEVQMAGRRC